MPQAQRSLRSIFSRWSSSAAFFALFLLIFMWLASKALGQKYTTLYDFGSFLGDGTNPTKNLVIDGAGNLFGTAAGGPIPNEDVGTIFELKCTSYDSATHSCKTYAPTDTVLYTFGGGSDGMNPQGLIMDGAGNLIGTTGDGGVSGNCPVNYYNGCGTIFELECNSYDAAAHSCTAYNSAATVLYRFTDIYCGDNAYACASLILDGAGSLFGTTFSGTIFKLPCTGFNASSHSCEKYSSAETVLYRLIGTVDGAEPEAGLILDGAGNLFGTAVNGGASYGGTIFELECKRYEASTRSCATYSSTDKVLYGFKESGDGVSPASSLILDGAGNLFGTTSIGGSNDLGTVFELACTSYDASTGSCTTYSAADEVLFSFPASGADGTQPIAALTLDGAGNLFGTSTGGYSDWGAVFELACISYDASTRSCEKYNSKSKLLHKFTDGSNDGGDPEASLILDRAGNLFGTTFVGDNSEDSGCGNGCGTIFEISGAAVPSGGVPGISLGNGGAITVIEGGSGTSALKITPSDGFRGTIRFQCTVASSPAGLTCAAPDADITGTASATSTLTATATSSTPLGKHTATVTASDVATGKTMATTAVLIAVYAKAQKISFAAPASPVTYGVKPITLSATSTSGLAVTFSVASGPAKISGTEGSTITITGAGTIIVAANQAGNSTYAAAPRVTHSITVDKAPLKMTANNLSFAHGQSVPALTYSSAGFVNGDTAAKAYTGSPKLTTTATSASVPGAYPIVIAAGTLKSVNYRFALKNGTMTVKPAGTIAMTAGPPKAGPGSRR
jgi:uncharacterized repeat protein (TIGR03803 family)